MTGLASTAVSGEARFISDRIDDSWRSLQLTRVLGNLEQFGELEELWDECRESGWDGYEAVAVTPAAIQKATEFLRSLPMSVNRPTLGAEPDGHVTFEWYGSPSRVLSVSINEDGLLHYSAVIGSSRRYGTEPFSGECPKEIVEFALRAQRK